MKEKLEKLRQSIKSLLGEAEKLIGEGKLDEAKAKQGEAATLRGQAEVVKAWPTAGWFGMSLTSSLMLLWGAILRGQIGGY